MFGLNPIPLYSIIALLFSNVAFVVLWQFADSRADQQEALVAKCAAEHRAFKDQVEAAGKIAQAQAKQKESENAKLVEDTAKGWAAAIGVVRADYAKRLRLATSGSASSGSVSKVSQDRPGHALPESDAIPAPERIATDCAETTVTANFLQAYIERLESLNERNP